MSSLDRCRVTAPLFFIHQGGNKEMSTVKFKGNPVQVGGKLPNDDGIDRSFEALGVGANFIVDLRLA